MRILFFLVILVTWTKFHFATSWDLEALFSESENGSGDQGEPKANENELRQVLNSQPLSKGKNKKQRNAKVEMGDILASDACAFSNDASKIIYSILCAVETGEWHIAHESQSMKEAQEGCLIGGSGSTRCDQKMRPPREEDVPKSPPPPDAKVKDYQILAEKAEKIVPETWWREGFSDDSLLLSHNDAELPFKQLQTKGIRGPKNKKLKNLNQCVTRQQFIRKSYSFTELIAEAEDLTNSASKKVPGGDGKECRSAHEPTVVSFFDQWKKDPMLGGEWKTSRLNEQNKLWWPSDNMNGDLYVSAMQALEHFLTPHQKEAASDGSSYIGNGGVGNIWTGCFKLQESAYCRGGLAAAAQVVAMHRLVEISAKRSQETGLRSHKNDASTLVEGYMLASLGRGLLHGDEDSTGEKGCTQWGVKLSDFVVLQQAYLRLYITSFGSVYSSQLDKNIPLSFPPGIDIYTKSAWNKKEIVLEPVYSSLRNWMYTESGNLIDFGPYRPLLATPEVRAEVKGDGRRRILIDVGANGFFASPKYMLDSYAPYLPFTEAIMIEPEPHFSASIPKAYSDRYNITTLKIYAEVNTGSDSDIIKLLPTLVTKDDYVVLKFDVDPNKHAFGPTMEWGFMYDLARNAEIAELVDELYIELHFHFPALYWQHLHSNWEALDALRFLRQKGAIVHAWP